MAIFDRDKFDLLLEDYLDGELSGADARRLESFAAADAEAGRELRIARLVQQQLRGMPQPTCPPEVTRVVLATARADARRGFAERLRVAAALSWSTIVRPSLAVGAFVGLIVAGAIFGRSTWSEPPVQTVASEEATPQEVEQALNEAKWALAYLSDVGRRTATTIRDDVLDQHVVQPVNRAFNAAFDDDPNIQ